MAERIVVARHGESVFSRDGLVNGDPSIECPLTELGREQATRLGHALRAIDLSVCVTSGFARTRETAELALQRRPVRIVVERDLNDPRLGSFESQRLTDYLEWHAGADWTMGPPGGGESQIAAIRRLTRAWTNIVARREPVVLVVCHALGAAFALCAADSEQPVLRRRYDLDVGYAEPRAIAGSELRHWLRRAASELAALDAASASASGALSSTSQARTTSRPTR